MKIGNIEFGPQPLFLAPMEDVTDIGFRMLCKRFGAAMVYTIKPPTIKIICRAIHHFSNIGMTGDNVMEAIKELPEATEDMLKGISCFICGNDSLVKELENGTFEEVKDALGVCFSMMDISAFQCVSSMRNVSMLAAKPKQ